jgi:hypothetical protein
MSIKNSNNTIGDWTCDLPAFSAMPQPTTPPAACPHTQGIWEQDYKNQMWYSWFWHHLSCTWKKILLKRFASIFRDELVLGTWRRLVSPKIWCTYTGIHDVSTVHCKPLIQVTSSRNIYLRLRKVTLSIATSICLSLHTEQLSTQLDSFSRNFILETL